MNIDEVVAAFQLEGRTLVRPGERLEALPLVTRRSWESGEIDDVTAFALDAENADRAVQMELSHFASLGRGFEWKAFSFDRPGDLVARLRAAGFVVGNLEAIVIYDLAEGLSPFAGPFACDVRLVQREEQLADFRFVAEDVFEKDYSLTNGQLADALRKGEKGHEAYIAYVHGEPASIGRLYTHPASAFAGFYGGGTRKDFRGRGYYRAIVAARAHAAAAVGARYLQVDALPTSLPILQRLGFTRVAHTWPCVWAPDE